MKQWAIIFCISIGLIGFVEFSLTIYQSYIGVSSQDEQAAAEVERMLNTYNWQKDRRHPYLGYTAAKNIDVEMTDIEPHIKYKIRTNSHGFRTHEFYPKRPGWVRVVIMGDSFVFGHNAQQDETIARVLESRLQERISSKIEVLSLGVASYSVVRYAALARLYMEFLKPDIVIVAVDQSDLMEDLSRWDSYELENGYPYILKDADALMAETQNSTYKFDVAGNLIKVLQQETFTERLSKQSAIAKTAKNFASYLRSNLYEGGVAGEFNRRMLSKEEELRKTKVVTFADLVAQYGEDVSEGLPVFLKRHLVPVPLEKAIPTYQPSFKSLEYIKIKADQINAKMYVSAYPYPWMITPYESMQHVLIDRKSEFLYDLSGSRVHPQLLDDYSSKLEVTFLDAYPVFEENHTNMWGKYDPHFNVAGYAAYANFLYEKIARQIEKSVPK